MQLPACRTYLYLLLLVVSLECWAGNCFRSETFSIAVDGTIRDAHIALLWEKQAEVQGRLGVFLKDGSAKVEADMFCASSVLFACVLDGGLNFRVSFSQNLTNLTFKAPLAIEQTAIVGDKLAARKVGTGEWNYELKEVPSEECKHIFPDIADRSAYSKTHRRVEQ